MGYPKNIFLDKRYRNAVEAKQIAIHIFPTNQLYTI